MASKIARIVDFCGKSSGLADFENTVDRGSAVIFGADSGLCRPMFGSWVLNKIWNIGLSSALVGMLLSSSKLFPLSKKVIVIGTALCYGHQVCCLLYYLDKISSGIHM